MTRTRNSPIELLAVFLRLGLTSFGGPVAHIGYFRTEFVTRRKWLDEATFADLVALCQFMPGPASSQVGMSIGLLRGGPLGMFAAWLGFTLPSALALVLFAYGVDALGDVSQAAWLKGLKLVAVAVVAQAVWGMARSLAPDRARASLAVAAALVALAVPSSLGQIAAILLGAAVGLFVLPRAEITTTGHLPLGVDLHRGVAAGLLLGFFLLLALLPLAAASSDSQAVRLVAAFYRAGALVFGGGHVVLPLLQAAVVPPGWVDNDAFLAGYGAAQAVPGPLFTFAAYLGTVMHSPPNGWLGGLLAVVAIFLPSFFLVAGLLPFWDTLRHRPAMQAALRGVNAAVVGVLLAALFTPVWTSAVHTPGDFGLGLCAFLLLTLWSMPPWLVVIGGAVVAYGLALIGVPL
jgi:chromate transporter